MTDEPWICGDGCPFRGCRECIYQGADSLVDKGWTSPSKRDNRTDVWDNETTPGECVNTQSGGLTRSSGTSREGLAP